MSYWNNDVDISEFIGKIFTKIEDNSIFYTAEKQYEMYHSQDCCESVDLQEIIGDISDIIFEEIINAYITDEEGENPEYASEAQEWTNFHIASAKGEVVFRWFGSSNGYYGTGVSISVKDIKS